MSPDGAARSRGAAAGALFEIAEGEEPIAAAAIHDGHGLRAEVSDGLSVSASDRLREEDPHTASFASVATTRLVARRSRFEVDLNRPRDRAVYLAPADAFGLEVWRKTPTAALVARSLAVYDEFYANCHRLFKAMEARHGRFVVLDLHSYNHRRGGPDAPFDDPRLNPEVNVGTGTLDRARWAALVDGFIGDLRGFDFRGRQLDVRENVKFRGGHFSRWIHESFPRSACCLAVEFKKFFMDEWTGTPDTRETAAIEEALRATVPGLRNALSQV